MVLSENTIAILKNFVTINPSILFEPGNKLKVVSPTEVVYAEALLEDEFPKEAGIGDVLNLLQVFAMDKENPSDLSWDDDCLRIKQGSGVIEYPYCDPDSFKHAKGNKITVKNPMISFVLTEETLEKTVRAMAVLRLKEMAISGRNGNLAVETISTFNPISGKFSTILGETDKEFVAIIDTNFKRLIPDTYNVTLSGGRAPIAKFKGNKATYAIALSMESHFEDS